MDNSINIPSFALYQIGSQTLNTCYQSKNQTIICSINGPYFERKKISLKPIFNIHIHKSNQTDEVEIASVTMKLKQLLKSVIVEDRYLRMSFDINFDIVEGQWTVSEMLSSFINLLSFSLMMNGIEIKSIFSCCRVSLKDTQINWSIGHQKDCQTLTMAIEALQKDILYSEFDGQYNFLHYQKLTNLLLDANEEFQKYILLRVQEINEKYK